MLAGLLFANHDADDRPNLLAATLPFAGGSLIEYQARLLIAAGAAQILVAVTRATPELVGAVNRIRKGGVPIDVVRTAAEALEKTHPLATLIVVADGLIADDRTVQQIAEGEGDALLVVEDSAGATGLERLDSHLLWAGIARVGPRRLADAARLPDEYDLQSTLLRVVAQGKPEIVELDPAAIRAGHGIERDSRALAQRGRRALGARLARRRPWIDRFVLTPIARVVLPPLVDRGVAWPWASGAGGVLGLIGVALILARWSGAGMVLATLGAIGLSFGQGLAWLGGADAPARRHGWAIGGLAALAVLLLGGTLSHDSGTATGWLAAGALLVAGALTERAAPDRARPHWWGSPIAYLALVTVLTLLKLPLAGLIAGAGYAAASLAAAIERLRDRAGRSAGDR
jgi:hypothetical protein